MFMQRRLGPWSILLPIFSFSAFLLPSAAAEDSAKVKAAREIFKLWAEGKYDAVDARCVDQVHSAMGPQKLAQAWASLEFQHGKYVGEKSAEEIPAGEYTAVRLTEEFERAFVKIRFVLTKDDKLGGLWFDAVEAKPDLRDPPYSPKGTYVEEKLTLKSGEYELPAILTRPASGNGPWPAVVFVHGSGPHDADETIGPNKIFRDMAWGLAAKGIASLRYEKRTRKYGATAKPEQLTLAWEVVDDAVAAAGLLRAQKGISADRVFIVGHSLGAFAAPFIAKRDAQLAGLVLVGASARPIIDLVEDQLEYLAQLDGSVSADERTQVDAAKQITAAIRSGKLQDAKTPLLGAPNEYWAELCKHDNVAATESLSLPILILQGGRDYQVTKKEYAIWQDRLGKKKNVTLQCLEPLNHLMIAGEGPSGPPEYQKPAFVDASAIDAMAGWIGAAPKK